MPSAPASSAAITSGAVPAFASSLIVRPSPVRAGWRRSRRSRSACSASRSARSRRRVRVGVSGESHTIPRSASTPTSSPTSTPSTPGPAPVTSGMPSERATMAAWAVVPPPASTIAARLALQAATSPGPRSSAITTDPAGGSLDVPVLRSPARRAIACRSAARAASSGSSSAASAWACGSIARAIASGALAPASASFAAASSRVGSCAISWFASTISASPAWPSRVSVRASSPSSSAASSSPRRARSASASGGPAPAAATVSDRVHAGPIAAPGEAGVPRITCGVTIPPPPCVRVQP